jgi:hypothetical protein
MHGLQSSHVIKEDKEDGNQQNKKATLLPPLTYVGMVLRQHTTKELQHPFPHRKRILVPPELGV